MKEYANINKSTGYRKKRGNIYINDNLNIEDNSATRENHNNYT
jgi:hypothetical protein